MFLASVVAGMALVLQLSAACKLVHVASDRLGTIPLSLMDHPDLTKSRRPVYKSADIYAPLHLYHAVANPASSGTGRWILNDALFSDSTALAFVDSWAVQPYFVQVHNDPEKSMWSVPDGAGGWTQDPSLTVTCGDLDSTTLGSAAYFLSSKLSPGLSGFYVEVSDKLFAMVNGDLFLYRHTRQDESLIWIIGDTPGLEAGLACVSDAADRPSQISKDLGWHFAVNGSWVEDDNAKLLFGNRIVGLYERQLKAKKVPHFPDGLLFYFLRNNIPIPAMGLGTDGMSAPAYSIMKALRRSYRMLDTSPLSGVESVIGRIFETHLMDETFPPREEVFLVSKVWPTNLGFEPTQSAVYQSLSDMHVDHVDLYLLQYPRCIHQLEWMGCNQSILKTATWRESWRALEKEYAEGRVLSIGVSNFVLEELKELVDFSVVRPHVVQNYVQPGKIDHPLIDYCKTQDIKFMAYSSLQYLNDMGDEFLASVKDIASLHWRTPEAIVLRSLVQGGVIVIPRSENPQHMMNNQNIFTWDLTEEQMRVMGW